MSASAKTKPTVKELAPEHLLTILDPETYGKILRFCAGYTIRFPEHKARELEIVEAYERLNRLGLEPGEIYTVLAAELEVDQAAITATIYRWRKKRSPKKKENHEERNTSKGRSQATRTVPPTASYPQR